MLQYCIEKYQYRLISYCIVLKILVSPITVKLIRFCKGVSLRVKSAQIHLIVLFLQLRYKLKYVFMQLYLASKTADLNEIMEMESLVMHRYHIFTTNLIPSTF